MIAAAQVISTLYPWLGARLSSCLEPMMEDLSVCMNGYSSRRDPDMLRKEIDSRLFQALRFFTRGTFLTETPDGTWVRIRTDDIAAMADELMTLVFEDFPTDDYHLRLLQQDALASGGLSALRALYTRFAPLQTAQELSAIAQVIRSCHPPFRWREWLD